MPLGLGNNLIRNGGGLNPDGLALDLQFAADKTLTARRGPSPILTRGSSATFVGSNGLIQTAAVNAARFDHDPVTLASRGLLIEEGRTNLVLQSENHPSATWTKSGVTVAGVTHTAPDGNTSSNLVSEDSSTGVHRLVQSTAYVSGTSYAISVFLKFAGRQFVAITHPAVAANGQAIFDIQNGSVTLQQSGVTASMVQYPNGWWRCVVNGVSSVTSGAPHIIQGSATGGSLTGSYTGLNGSAFYIYGSQIEAGSFATSYIPTTTSALARSADVCSITGANFTNLWNASEGTMFASGNTIGTASKFYFYLNAQGSPSTSNAFLTNFGASAAVIQKDTPQAFKSEATISSSIPKRLAYAYTSGATSSSSINGLIPTPSTNNATASVASASILEIGGTSTTSLSGWLTSARYYKKRLSNQKLQALTA